MAYVDRVGSRPNNPPIEDESAHHRPGRAKSVFRWMRPRATTLLATVSLLTISAGGALAIDQDGGTTAAPATNDALMKKLQAMEQRIQTLEGQLKRKQASASTAAARPSPQPGAVYNAAAPAAPQQAAPPNAPAKSDQKTDQKFEDKSGNASGPKGVLGLVDSPVPGLSLGAYGELKFGAMQNPAANGQWQNGFDTARMVLLPTYAITDNIIFNAEIEFEHGGIAFDSDDKLHGSVDVEQIFIDFKIIDQFNWRAPGIDLVPIGYINEHHEPTQFYSVNRPEIYNGLIPSTFRVPGTRFYGDFGNGVTYAVQASASIEDYGDDFGRRTDANAVPPFPTGYAAGITGHDALALSRPPVGDFRQLSNTIAVAGRLEYQPSWLAGFATSASVYFTPSTTPRGAYADSGAPLGNSSLTLFDAEFRYRIPSTGLELRGEYAQAAFGHPENLRANNDSDPTDNVGKRMYAYSGEVAYHQPLGTILNSEWELVPFYRYTYENLQTNGFAGSDLNTPTGAGQLQFHTMGIAVFPSPKLVLKATYQKVKSSDPAGAQSDSFLGALGFFF